MGVDDLDEYLSIELKSEMAASYFGFRKLIEEDTLAFQDKLRQYSFILEKRISFDLIRIYILLGREELIDTFLGLCHLGKKPFYDPYLLESATIRARVFASVRMRGLTRQGRFLNFLTDCYDRLALYVESYRKKYQELEEMRADITEEIRLFEKKHDISAILTFLHALDAQPLAGHMSPNPDSGVAQEIAAKLKIPLPEEVICRLPPLPPLPACQEIKKELLCLGEQAYALQSEAFLVIFGTTLFRPRP
jgi:hypothetical protein